MGKGLRNLVAAIGAGMSGYAQGRAIHENNEFQREQRDRIRAQWRDQDEIRKAMAGLADAPSADTAPAMGAEAPALPDDAPASGLPSISPVDGRPVRPEDETPLQQSHPADLGGSAPGLSLRPASMQPATERADGMQAPASPPASDFAQRVAERGQRVGEVQHEIAVMHDKRATDAYLTHKAPAVINAYLKQGKLAEAKAFRDFVDAEDGRRYVQTWARGARKLSLGDNRGALGEWEKLYNAQTYDDGHTVKLTALDGDQMRIDQFGPDGKQVATRSMPIADLARQAGIALSPERLVEFQTQQQAKREAEAAALSKAVELENLRQQGQESREDRRDERTRMQIHAMDRRHAASLAARDTPGRLTTAQERANAEIDAAREAIAGLTPQDIQRRTAKATNTGRENPDYDPGLARQVALAGRRKLGDDAHFDQRQPPKDPAVPADVQDIADRFARDPAMKTHRLGRMTPKGREVIDASGRLLGHYQ